MALAGTEVEDQVHTILFHFCHVCSMTKDAALGHIGFPADLAALVSCLSSKESHFFACSELREIC